MGVQADIAPVMGEGDDLLEAGGHWAGSGCGWGVGCGADDRGAIGYRAQHAAAGVGAGRGWSGCGRGRGVAQVAEQIAGGGGVGDEAEADEHHVGARAAVGRLIDVGEAFLQHLPKATEPGDRELLGERAATGAFEFGQGGAGGEIGDRFQP